MSRMFTRRDFLAATTSAVAVSTLSRLNLFAQAPQQPAAAPVLRELRRNAGFWTGRRGGTIGWLMNPSGVVVIDSQGPETAAMCLEQVLAQSKTTEIAALINTHHHGDHTGGNGVFKPKTKQIIGHVNIPKYMKAGYDQAIARRAEQNPPPTTPPPPEPVVPDRTLTNTWEFDHGDEHVAIKHYGPAHTGGDVVIHFQKANVTHMGDLMFNRLHPVIDRANGANIANWSKILKTVAAEMPGDTIYVFGHAGEKFDVTGTKADLGRHSDYLMALLDYVRAQIKAGKARDEIVASKDPIKGFEDYGPLLARSLTPAYDEVAG